MTDGHGEEYRRVPSDGATSDYPTARLHAPLYGRAHISYAVGKLVAPPRRIMPCVIALIYYRARRDDDNAPSVNILRKFLPCIARHVSHCRNDRNQFASRSSNSISRELEMKEVKMDELRRELFRFINYCFIPNGSCAQLSYLICCLIYL